MIEGVLITPLRRIPDERGSVMHMLRCDDTHFKQFGEIYFSTAFPGVVKGWHLHTRMTLNYAAIVGNVKVVLYDSREGSATYGECQEIFLGPDNYALLTIPPGIWNGWQAIGVDRAILANCATLPHDPAEIQRLDLRDEAIPYSWFAGSAELRATLRPERTK